MKKKIKVPWLLNVVDLAYKADMSSIDLHEKLEGRSAWRAKELKQVRAAITKHIKEMTAMLADLED